MAVASSLRRRHRRNYHSPASPQLPPSFVGHTRLSLSLQSNSGAIELRGIDKRYKERDKEIMRRERLIIEEHKEVSRLISEAETKRQG